MRTKKVFNRFLVRSELGVQSTLYEQYGMLIKYHAALTDYICLQWHDSEKTHYWSTSHPEHVEYVRFINHRKRLAWYIRKYEMLISFSIPQRFFGKGSGMLPVKYSGVTMSFNSSRKLRQEKAA